MVNRKPHLIVMAKNTLIKKVVNDQKDTHSFNCVSVVGDSGELLILARRGHF